MWATIIATRVLL
ncbi:hypothetical protein PMI24_01611 [Pseudomonas sp. GM25]|nr:hypothetical protein PMI24_01611 [Pseudomonas sp. GM25]